jgi:hypothetical protein
LAELRPVNWPELADSGRSAPETTLWGTILIVGVQLYLLIHLLELSKKLRATDPGWEVAWIGIYHGRVARCLFAASAFLLHFVTIGVLGYKAITAADDTRALFHAWVVSACRALASTSIAFLTERNRPNASAAP